MIRSIAAILALLSTTPVITETVQVRGRGPIELESYACTDTPRSTIVQRVCYDEARSHLLVSSGGTYSEYCGLSASTFEAFVIASSMGHFFRQRIASVAQFSCNRAGTN